MSNSDWHVGEPGLAGRRPGAKSSEALASNPGVSAPLSHPSDVHKRRSDREAGSAAETESLGGAPPSGAEARTQGGEPSGARPGAPGSEPAKGPDKAPKGQVDAPMFGFAHQASEESSDGSPAPGDGAEAEQEAAAADLRTAFPAHAAPVGLSNLGNTCFMNSGIQCFMSSWIIQRLLVSAQVTQRLTGVVPSLRKLLLRMSKPKEAAPAKKSAWGGWGGWGSGYSPGDIKAACQRINPVFRGYGQQDSFELIQALIEGVISETNAVTGKLPYKELNTGKLPLDESYEVQKSYYLSRTQSPFSKAISGVYLNEFRCTKCKHVSYVFEFSQTLSLGLTPHQAPSSEPWGPPGKGAQAPGKASAQPASEAPADSKPRETGALDAREDRSGADAPARKPSALDCGNPYGKQDSCCPWRGQGYGKKGLTLLDCIDMAFAPHVIPEHKCDSCLSNAPVEVRTSIFVPPEVLIIQLKRFSAGKGSWGGMSKDERSVSYSEHIDLARFLSDRAPACPAEYSFSAASLHGGSLFGGHYTAVVSDHRKYYYCNDSSVHQQDAHLPSEAYVLVFEREDALRRVMASQGPGQGE